MQLWARIAALQKKLNEPDDSPSSILKLLYYCCGLFTKPKISCVDCYCNITGVVLIIITCSSFQCLQLSCWHFAERSPVELWWVNKVAKVHHIQSNILGWYVEEGSDLNSKCGGSVHHLIMIMKTLRVSLLPPCNASVLHSILYVCFKWLMWFLDTCTRVGTLIVTTIYLQLIQNRYMFRSFTVLHCSHQHCVQPVASDVEVVGYL